MSYRIVYNKITFAYQRTTSDEGPSVRTTVEPRITYNATPSSVGTTTQVTAIEACIVYVVLSCVLIREDKGRVAFADYCDPARVAELEAEVYELETELERARRPPSPSQSPM